MHAPTLDRGLWPTVGHLVHTIATRGRLVLIDPTDLLVYRSAIYPQWKTFKYGLGGRLPKKAPSSGYFRQVLKNHRTSCSNYRKFMQQKNKS